VVKAGLRKSKAVDKQIYLCNKCGKKFAISPLPCYTYDAQAILSAPILYYQGLSLEETRKKIIAKFQITPSLAAVAKWVKEFGKYSALKNYRPAIKLFKKNRRLISRKLLKHQQNYLFQIHEYKLGLLPSDFSPIQDYLHKILNDEITIDHRKFQLRGSTLDLGASFPTLRPAPHKTYENRTAEIALKAAGTPSEFVVYPEAGHGFHADFRPDNYRKADAEDGWRRMLEWFRKYGV
jgi:acetyl esterase/lipase